MSLTDLPTLNAILNMISAVLLIAGRMKIKKGDRLSHKKFMIAALVSSALFLTFYVVYHAQVGSVPYPYYNWTRYLYFIILLPHIILAAIMTPFILLAVFHALRDNFDKHKRIVRWLWPVWIYVSFSGVTIYLMLYII